MKDVHVTRARIDPDRAATRSWIWRYPAVTGVVASGIVAGVLTAARLPLAADVVIGAVTGAIAVWWMVRFVRAIRTGRWGLDLLAVMAVISTLAVREFWAALVIALMMTGGQ
ncbi:MAG TPA: hypothetical protein VN759_10320, partial [Pseudolysinimonas sp.]|nr:hypothetical protein [Pseudolysinimonas sp.]